MVPLGLTAECSRGAEGGDKSALVPTQKVAIRTYLQTSGRGNGGREGEGSERSGEVERHQGRHRVFAMQGIDDPVALSGGIGMAEDGMPSRSLPGWREPKTVSYPRALSFVATAEPTSPVPTTEMFKGRAFQGMLGATRERLIAFGTHHVLSLSQI